MNDYLDKAKEYESKWQKVREEYFTLKDILIYIILSSAVFSLGLMNFTDFSFDLERITWSYFAHSLTQVIAYGAIIGSFTSKQLDKRKTLSKELKAISDYNYKVLDFYRPEKLKEYIDTVNLQAKKDAFIDKYRQLISDLELEYDKKDKSNSFTYDKSWKEYIKEKAENPKLDPPNTYCYKKEYYLEKLKNIDVEFETDSVAYERLTIEDLTSGIRKSQKHRIPRLSETKDASFGVARSMTLMVATSLLTAGFILTTNEGGLDAIVKSLITLFVAVYSAFKGMMNGERVFFNTTLLKEQFRKHHLHSYSVYEAKNYKFIVGNNNEVQQQNQNQ